VVSLVVDSGGSAAHVLENQQMPVWVDTMWGTYQSRKSKLFLTSENVIALLLALIWSSGKSTIPGRKA
jgi:hypothetical protein